MRIIPPVRVADCVPKPATRSPLTTVDSCPGATDTVPEADIGQTNCPRSSRLDEQAHADTIVVAPDRRMLAVHPRPSAHRPRSTQGALYTPLTTYGSRGWYDPDFCRYVHRHWSQTRRSVQRSGRPLGFLWDGTITAGIPIAQLAHVL